MSLWPGFAWFVTPSGGPYPRPWSLWTILYEAPLPAHAAGGWLALLIAWPFVHGWRQYVLALVICGVWQAAKWNDEVYGASWPREIGWRLAISTVSKPAGSRAFTPPQSAGAWTMQQWQEFVERASPRQHAVVIQSRRAPDWVLRQLEAAS